jgi:hypothetical protein
MKTNSAGDAADIVKIAEKYAANPAYTGNFVVIAKTDTGYYCSLYDLAESLGVDY